MSIKIGDKVTVRKGAGDYYENCGSKNAAYLIITYKYDDGSFNWHAYDKDGERINSCGLHHLKESDFIPYNRTIEDVQEGDLLKKDTFYRRVLGRAGQTVFLTPFWQEGEKEEIRAASIYSIQELKDAGWKLVDEDNKDSDITELTLEEVAQLKGIPVEKLRIKEK